MASVFGGLLLAHPQVAQFDMPDRIVFLWIHESERTYGDRLVCESDILRFRAILQSTAKKAFPVVGTAHLWGDQATIPLCFSHFRDVATLDYPAYGLVEDINTLRNCFERVLRDYNEFHPAMDLVLFRDALLHVARITRTIFQPGGHILLVGVGGSGKQSLARLSTHICGHVLMRICITSSYGLGDFRLDLQSMFTRSGTKMEGVVFLFTDSQIINEKFLVYLNDLLASGSIPDLFSKDERDNLASMVEGRAKAADLPADTASCWEYFLTQVRANLHIAVCFSPVGPDFGTYAKRFPALISGTTIDWFQRWPDDALQSIAEKQLGSIEFKSPALRSAIEKFMPVSFEMATKAAVRYQREVDRFVYLTPKSYLEMLALYRTLLLRRREENKTATMRLENGISRLREAASAVGTLGLELTAMVQAADEKREHSEAIAARVASEKMIVERETDKANGEAAKVAKIQGEVQRQNEDAERDLLAAEPAIRAATAALDTLDRRDLGSCKTMATPPSGVEDVFSAVCVLLAGIIPAIAAQRNGKVKKEGRSWDACKKSLLGNINGLVDKLKQFKALIDKECVPKINFKEVRPYLQMDHFNEDAMNKKNSAAAGLVKWVENIVRYYDIWLDVEPKRIKVVESTRQLETANSELAVVCERVNILQAQLRQLTSEFEQAENVKREAVDIAEKGQLKLELAQRLINALGSEEVRWVKSVERFRFERDPLVGDALVAASFISFLPEYYVFSRQFRKPKRDLHY